MNTLYWMVGAAAIVAFIVYLGFRYAKSAGKAEAKADHAIKEAKDAQVAGAIVAQDRTNEQVLDDLNTGKFGR